MPTLISRGTASARAFGLTGSSSGQLYTQTFTSNGTFTPIPGVTNVVTLVGQGGSSTSDYEQFGGRFASRVQFSGSSPLPNPPPLYWTDVAADVFSAVAQLNLGGYHPGYTFNLGDYYVSTNTTWSGGTYSRGYDAYTKAGSFYVTPYGQAPNPPSGVVGQDEGGYQVYGTNYESGSNGGPSSALGYSFPGASQVGSFPFATGQSATPVTYNNIAVTPGTNYPISVSGGGYVAISYIIP